MRGVDSDASWDADYDPEDYPTARRPYHWLTPEQVQSLVEESQQTYLEKQNEQRN